MRLILARHGETEENLAQITHGHKPGKLTTTGIEQAKKLALRLKEEKIDRIYVSDLKRAVDTAAEIIRYHPNAEVTYAPELREQAFGIYEGKPWGTVAEEAKKAGIRKYDFKIQGGESWPEMTKRITDFVHALIHKEKDKTILIVSHGGPIRFFLISFLKVPEEKWDDYKHENCAVTILDIDEKGHRINSFKCVKHLTEN